MINHSQPSLITIISTKWPTITDHQQPSFLVFIGIVYNQKRYHCWFLSRLFIADHQPPFVTIFIINNQSQLVFNHHDQPYWFTIIYRRINIHHTMNHPWTITWMCHVRRLLVTSHGLRGQFSHPPGPVHRQGTSPVLLTAHGVAMKNVVGDVVQIPSVTLPRTWMWSWGI